MLFCSLFRTNVVNIGQTMMVVYYMVILESMYWIELINNIILLLSLE